MLHGRKKGRTPCEIRSDVDAVLVYGVEQGLEVPTIILDPIGIVDYFLDRALAFIFDGKPVLGYVDRRVVRLCVVCVPFRWPLFCCR